MAGLRSVLKKENDHDAEAFKEAKVLAAKTPIVAEILGGSPAAKGEEPIAPGTITFFFREGKWRFSANVKSASKTFIGDVGDILKPWESIEFAMSEGECRQRDYTERTNGSATKPGDVPVY